VEKRQDNRRALRIMLDAPTTVRSIGLPEVKLHENLVRVYQRVIPEGEHVGQSFECRVRDLSTNGAFIAGEPLPLLSRVSFSFHLDGYGELEIVGWTLWRRQEDCEIPRAEGKPAVLPRGFGVLFEAIPLDARLVIHSMVTGVTPKLN
jgi:hypothetical protein